MVLGKAVNLQKVLEERRSVRKFQDKEVPGRLVHWLIALAQTAPSAGGIRGYEMIVTKKPVAQYQAPVYLVVCARPEAYVKRYGDRGRNLYALQDATIVGAYIQLIAVDMGLATVWVGAFRESKIKKMLGLADGLRPIAIFPLGYAA